jgi:pyrroline-5-carboxylate reductase
MHQLGIIGAGNMASAVVAGLLRGGVIPAGQIIASSPSSDRRARFTEQFGVRTTADNCEVAADCCTLLLAVKPQKAADVLDEISLVIPVQTLIVSVMAGVTSAVIDARLGNGRRVVRTMPNTPMQVGRGMIAVAPGPRATADDLATARALFSSAGTVVDVREDQIDAVIAVSGSGPAYFFYLVERMTTAGVEFGLSPDQAHLLATRTCQGAAAMMVETGRSPVELRTQVTSPGGTTAAAIGVMETRGLGEIVQAAMDAAVARSVELSSQTSKA